ncbi:MAG: aspartate aminotransferase family protein [Gemmatimonadaceae bacterium]|nr:aspartate aminotransferase family protein [Gemmatimonadaceae bacterium]
MKDLLKATTEHALQYLDSLQSRRVAPDPEAVANLKSFDVALPREGTAPSAVIDELDRLGRPATMAMPGPRFFGFVIGGSLPAALAANWLVSAWDQNTGLYNSTPATSYIEEIALKWLIDLLGLPPHTAGAFVSGTSVAHVTALAAARHSVLERAGWDVESDGLFGAPPVSVIIGQEAHPTLHKALGIIGFGRKRVIEVAADSQGRMQVAKIPRVSGPAVICVQAGNVNTGSFDAISDACDAAEEIGAWVHVDGAFGLWANAAPTHAHLVAGVERADSWATDGHKWLNVPYDSGIAFVRDAKALRAAMSISAEYLPHESEHRNPSDFTPELSRRGRGVDIWAALKSLGRRGVTEMIERHCRQARRFAEGLSAAGFEILNDVVLNQVLVSFGTAEETQRVIAGIQEDGTCWCGGTVWQGRTAMRISVISWNTTDADVELSLRAMIHVANALRRSE